MHGGPTVSARPTQEGSVLPVNFATGSLELQRDAGIAVTPRSSAKGGDGRRDRTRICLTVVRCEDSETMYRWIDDVGNEPS